jgi:predicted P-loop ATPase
LTRTPFQRAEPGEEITNLELEGLTARLLAGVADGLSVTHLFGVLDDHDNALMTRLAYHDEFELTQLEDKVRAAILDRGEAERVSSKFNLTRYRKAAKVQRERFREAKERRAAMALRNGKIDDNAKPDEEVSRVLDETQDPHTQVKRYSQSAYLKSIGLLEIHFRGRIWYDDFYNNVFTDWNGQELSKRGTQRPIDDAFILGLYEWLQLNDINLAKSLSEGTVRQAVQHFSRQDTRNEPRDWITRLQWDGNPRLSTWLSKVYGVDQDEEGYHAAVGRCWMVSMAARIMEPGCKVDTMPVLIGPQGNGKSTSLSILGGPWYKTINTSIDKYADFLMSLSGTLVAEIAELDAISRAADSRVKSMLSTAVDVYRPPYGRTTEAFKRTAVLTGSTNDKGNWHKDDSGGRRYWPIEVDGEIDLQWVMDNREQMFAEALVLYDGGKGQWHEVPKEAQTRRIGDHHVTDAWQEKIERWIGAHAMGLWLGQDSEVEKDFGNPAEHESTKYWGTVLTTSRLAAECMEIAPERQTRVTQVRVAQAMRNLGFELIAARVSGHSPKKVWITRRYEIDEFGLKLLPSNG